MGKKDWQELVIRYAAGRPICNCGEAYYTPCGRGIDVDGIKVTNTLICEYGCSANKVIAKEEIAARVLADLTLKGRLCPQKY